MEEMNIDEELITLTMNKEYQRKIIPTRRGHILHVVI